MTKKKITKSTKTSFFKKLATNKGFYITLCSILAIVGFSILSANLKNNLNDRFASVDNTAWHEAIAETEVEVIDVDELPTEDTAPVVQPSQTFDPETVLTSAPPPKTEVPKFSMDFPLDGEIIAPCSLTELVFCESMQDWRTHNGTDIAAAIGEPVRAAESGKISQVYTDDQLGVVVVIDHGNNISSRQLAKPGFYQCGNRSPKR